MNQSGLHTILARSCRLYVEINVSFYEPLSLVLIRETLKYCLKYKVHLNLKISFEIANKKQPYQVIPFVYRIKTCKKNNIQSAYSLKCDTFNKPIH